MTFEERFFTNSLGRSLTGNRKKKEHFISGLKDGHNRLRNLESGRLYERVTVLFTGGDRLREVVAKREKELTLL